MRWFLYVGVAVLLAGCGGGGGGGDVPGNSVTFSPSTVNVTQYAGESQQFSVVADVSGDYSGTVYSRVVIPAGVMTLAVPLSQQTQTQYKATFAVAGSLAAGTYTGNLYLQICHDAACTQQYPGSPFSLPYKITNISHTNLTPLSSLGVPDWTTVQGNNQHTGYVPATFSVQHFSLRWLWQIPQAVAGGTKLNGVVVNNGVVYMTTTMDSPLADMHLYAVSEQDKTLAWSDDIGFGITTASPAISGSSVIVFASLTSSWLDFFAASDGTHVMRTSVSGSNFNTMMPPLIDGGSLYTQLDGGSLGIGEFDSSTGAALWQTANGSEDAYSPALGADALYLYYSDHLCGGCGGFHGLKAVSRTTGDLLFQVSDPNFPGAGGQDCMTPALPDPDTVISLNACEAGFSSVQNRLINFNVSGRSIRWSVAGRFVSAPAVANGVVYVENAYTGKLEARSLATGALQWSWHSSVSGDTDFYGNVIVTDSHVFLSTANRVVAVNLSTHSEEWSYPRAGRLSLSANGILYVVRTDGVYSQQGCCSQFINNGYVAAVNLH